MPQGHRHFNDAECRGGIISEVLEIQSQVSAAFPRRVVDVLDMSLERVLHREELAADVALEAVFGVDVLRVSRQ